MKKRGHGEGTLETLPSGKVRLVRMVDGKRLKGPAIEPESRLLLTKKKATAAWEEVHNQSTRQQSVSPERPNTLAWLIYARWERTQDPVAAYLHNKWLQSSEIGRIFVPQLLSKDIDALVSKMNAAGLTPATINRYLGVISTEINRLIDDGILDRNPCRKKKLKVQDDGFKQILTAEDIEEFLALPWPKWYRVGLLLMLHGLRGQEARGVYHEDWDGDILTIRRVRTFSDVRLGTKTGKVRQVPITHPELLKHLNSKATGPVWVTDEGEPVSKTHQRSVWEHVIVGPRASRKNRVRALHNHKFTKLTPHDLRSTCTTRLIENGVDPRTVAEIMGHDVKMTLAIYARSRHELKTAAMKGLWITPRITPRDDATKQEKG